MAGEVTKAKLDGLKDGIADLLNRIDTLIRLEAYAEKLPIIGDKLATATPALETLTTLSNVLRAAVDAVANISDLATKTTTEVAQALNNAIAPYLTTLAGNANPFGGTVLATVDGSGNVVLTVDMGRTVDVTFTLGNLGMSGLGLDLAGEGNVRLSYNLDFRMGADATGFWFDPAASNLAVGAKVDLNGLSAGANLGILHFAVSNIDDNGPAYGDTLNFDIASTWSSTGLIRSFTADIVDFKASGTVDLDLHLAGDLSSAALPSIGADFHVDWGFSQSLLNGSGANSWNPATVGFTNVQYNFGSYVENTIRPIVDALVPVLKPINEALAIFRTDFQGALPGDWRVPLDVNHDGAVTLLDFLQKAGEFTGNPIDTAPISALIDLIDQVVDFAEFLVGKDFSDAGYQIGDYSTQLAAVQGAATALASLNVGTSGFTGTTPALGGFLSSLTAGNATGFGAMSGGKSGAALITDLVNTTALNFPLIENPLSLIKLLIGQDVDLFKLDMPTINLGTGLTAGGNLASPLTVFTFPIWPFPLVEVKVNVAAQVVADLAFGYDTAGLRYWTTQGANLANIADIFTHGFYLDDQRSGGTDVAEFIIRAAIELAVTASAGVTIGGGGNIMGVVALNIADVLTTPDGRLHLSDFPTQFGIANPFAIFDVDGQVSAGVRFWADTPFGSIFNYNSPRVPLLNFSNRQDAIALGVSAAGNTPAVVPPPPGLADVITSGGVTGLWIAVGPRAGERDIPDKTDGAEVVQIGSGGTGKLAVAGFGYSQLFDLADFTTIQADAANGNDEIVIDAGVTVSARLTGGAGNDFLQGGDAGDMLYGGTEDDYLAGGAGDDRIDGEDGNDRLEGGAGADALYGGNGPYDTATYVNATGVTLNLTNPLLNTGDALGDTFVSVEIFEGSNAADTMVGSAGADIFTALAGNDTLQGLGGDDTLAPGLGANTIDGGDGYDIVNYYNIPTPVTVIGTAGGYTVVAGPLGAPTVTDTITNVEQIDGSPYGDLMTGDTANDVFVGREGNDTLDGGLGDDTLVGGLGADTLKGGAGTGDRASYILSTTGVTASLLNPGINTGEAIGDTYQDIEGLRGSQFADTLSGDDNANLLQGAEGNDTLNGNGGGDTLQGGIGADVLNGGGGKDIASYYNSSTSVVLDLQTRANDENDAVNDSFTSIEVYQGTKFSDRLTGSNGMEELWGEEGNDRLKGMGGDDFLWGGAGGDEIDGGDGADIIEGSAGNDDILGGAGIDSIQGGDDADTIHGDGDGDFLSGDAGDDYVYGDAGTDSVGGGTGIDHVYGGVDNDSVSGGDGDDFVFGDAGNDTVSGGQGNDLIDGGADRDRISYIDGAATAGVRANLGASARLLNGVTVGGLSAIDGYGTTDTFVAVGGVGTIEDATGSVLNDAIGAHEGGSDIEGLDGDDILLGLQGGDTLKGGAGADFLSGADGNDTINGGAGDDTMIGGADIDWATYEGLNASVNASLNTGIATDSLGGVDTLAGFENLRGTAGGDTLTGDDGVNRIEGLGGNDTIDGFTGADTLVGGAGDDIYYVNNAGGDPTQPSDDTIIEDSGSDLVKSSVNYTLAAGLEDLQLVGQARIGTGNGDGNRMIGNALNNVLDGQFGADTFWGYAGDDTYVFDQLGDRIGTSDAPRSGIIGAGEVVNGGNDTIKLATTYIVGRDVNGNEYVWTYSLNDTGFDQVENVELTDNIRRVDLVGNALGNRLIGNAHSSITRGEDGDDFLSTGTGGADDIRGGSGLDTLIIEWGAGTNGVRTYAGPTANATLGGWNGAYDTPSGGGSVGYTSIERFEITTGSGGDDIYTADGDDIVTLNAGNDFVNIGSGFDRADGGADRDGITANYATETLAIRWNLTANTYSEGADGTDNDKRAFTNFEFFGTLTTGTGNDVIVTKQVDNSETINTGAGDDRITVFEGGDTVNGGIGLDTLVIDWSANGNGKRTYDAPVANAALGGWNGYFDTPSGGGSVRFTSIERFEITTGSGADDIVTADGDDIVTLNAGDDFVNIGSGFDRADGGANRDGITANYGTDTLAIHWDLTANTYSEGADGTANDKRAFTNFEYFGTLTTGTGNDVIVTKTGANNETINTGLGDDRITVFEGGDTVHGGAGLDTLVIDWSANGNGKRTYDAPVTNAALGGWNGYFDTPSGGGAVAYTSIERFEITTGSGADGIVTADGDDIVTLNAGDDFVNIGSGFDRADGGADRDGITANYGTDTLAIHWNLTANTYSEGIDGTANDKRAFTNFEYFGTLTTGSGNDVIVTKTGANNETINTGLGDDRITVFEGGDAVHGGAGLDTLVIDWSANGNGKRTYDAPVANAALGGWNGAFDTPSGGGSVGYTSIERFEITTGGGDDSIVTANGDDIVRLNGGNDYVNVGAGLDQADGGMGFDQIAADYSAETLAIRWNLVANTYSEGDDGIANDTRAFANFEAFGIVRTGSGNDVIVTGTAVVGETIHTGAGDDRVTVMAGGDTVNAGLGLDTLVMDWSANPYGVRVYTVLTANATLGGWDGAFDIPSSGWGVTFTSVERFEFSTGNGADSVVTANGNDIVRLSGGDDFVNVGTGLDQADGGSGSDGITADYSAETVAIHWNLTANTYSEGSDGITGDTRAFTNFEFFGTLLTGSGDDVIVTTTGYRSEVIRTGAGNDRVTFREGDDDFFGGDGNDTLIVDWRSNANYVRMETARSDNAGGGYNGDFGMPSSGWYASFNSVENFEVYFGNGDNAIQLGNGNDIAELNGGNDSVDFGSGIDRGDGGTGVDILSADYSADTAVISWDMLTGAYSDGAARSFVNFEGVGTFKAGSGNDVIVSGKLRIDETFRMGDGDDIVTSYNGSDAIHGGAGTDTLVIDWSQHNQWFAPYYAPSADAAGGYAGMYYNGSINLYVSYTSIEKFHITTGDAGDDFSTADGDDKVWLLGANDRVSTAGGNDYLDGGTGDDYLNGGTGDDIYIVDSLGDAVIEGAAGGTDEIRTTVTAYSIAGNGTVENLTGISATAGQTLTGNTLDNVIRGSIFGDIIDGGAGNDRLYGGSGNDFFKMGSGALNEIFGDDGTDTLVLSGTLADYSFSQNADGRAKVNDSRDPFGTVGYLSSIERIEIEGGSITLAQAIAGNLAARLPGTTGNDVVTIAVPGGLTDLSQGGSDRATGSTGPDAVLFGAALDPTDQFDGADGFDDIGLQGNYRLVFGAGLVRTEQLDLLSGSDTRFGAPGSVLYSYDLTTDNANVATGVNYVVQANALLAGENLKFDGRAETDGSFLLYAGNGIDAVVGGAKDDGFYFGNGRFTTLDSVDGFDGPNDQLGLRGDYSAQVVLGRDSIKNIDIIVLISSTDPRFGAPVALSNFNIKSHDANVAAGATMTIQAQTLQSNETAIFDGSAETNGQFFFIGGAGADRFIGGEGADRVFGAGGADTLTGGAGNDSFIYNREANSTPAVFDTITDFAIGDIIDLALVDAIAGGGTSNDGFGFVADGIFTGVAGQLRARADGDYWFVEGDTNGDGVADLTIRVTSNHALTATDFIL